MGRYTGTAPLPASITMEVPLGGISEGSRSGLYHKAVGEVISRASYASLSSSFPRNGSFASLAATLPNMVWNSIAYGNGVFVAVGSGALVSGSTYTPTNIAAVSTDGKNWQQIILPASQSWKCVAFGNGTFIAVARSGSTSIVKSTDGFNWTSQTMTAYEGVAICYGGGIWVITGGDISNASLSSPDGVTWTARTMPSTGNWNRISYGGGLFIATDGSNANVAAKSANGTTWSAVTLTLASGATASIAFGFSKFFIASGSGSLISTADGVTFTTIEPNANTIQNIVYADGVLIALATTGSGDVALVSYDGSVFYQHPLAFHCNVGAYGAGVYAVAATVPADSTVGGAIYAENLETSSVPSAYMYLSGPAGKFVRVQ